MKFLKKLSVSDSLKAVFEAVLNHFERSREYMNLFAKFRIRSEGWAKVEVLQVLSILKQKHLIETFSPEKGYPHGGKCDVFFKINTSEFWMEIKTIPTNYCGGYLYSRPITMFIDDVCSDIKKLKEVGGDQRMPLFLMIAYPFCGGLQETESWDKHIAKILRTWEETYSFSSQITERSVKLEDQSAVRIFLLSPPLESLLRL